MNTKIAALKKKIELKNKQLETKEDFLLRCKEAVKELRHELELLQGKLATEEMREMAELLSEKNLSFEDVKAAVASGVIVGKTKENENNDKTEEGIAEISHFGLGFLLIIMNLMGGTLATATAPIAKIASDPLGWLFGWGNSGGASNSIEEVYGEYFEKAEEAINEAKDYYREEAENVSYGERDKVILNGSYFYPASSAEVYIQNVIDEFDCDDYPYLIQMAFIQKQREERAANGLSEDVIPEVILIST